MNIKKSLDTLNNRYKQEIQKVKKELEENNMKYIKEKQIIEQKLNKKEQELNKKEQELNKKEQELQDNNIKINKLEYQNKSFKKRIEHEKK